MGCDESGIAFSLWTVPRVAEFKTRFDNQVKSNLGAGVPSVSDATRATDFLSKLDPRRYSGMLTQKRNNACQNFPEAYPPTLAAASRNAECCSTLLPPNAPSLVQLDAILKAAANVGG
jgi:hypothetical protein